MARKNTVIAQAKQMEAVTFLDLDMLNSDDSINVLKRVVCTNASIEKFFKNRYNADDPNTYLWDKFDLIALDEAHALTTDATFTDCFYTERFLKHTYVKNKKCDIIFMSGTLAPLDWMIDADTTPPIHDLDCFDECLHLEPNYVWVANKDRIPNYMYNLWKSGEKFVYFANFKKSIAKLTTFLMKQGVPADNLGYSFNYLPKDKELDFPKEIADSLEQRIKDMNTALTTEEIVPDNIKILFTTSKNKEGINILNDDIKTTFAETHNKSELTQIAGRVRGNPENGEGIERLIIIADADQHHNYPNKFLYTLNKHIAAGLTATLKECISKGYDISSPNDLLKRLPQYDSKDKPKDAYKYIRYDYIGENFVAYKGYVEGEEQHRHDILEFKEIARDSVLRKNSAGQFMALSGKEVMEEEWFRWSEVYILSDNKDEKDNKKREDSKVLAREKMLQFLENNNYIGEGKYITIHDRDVIIRAEIERIAEMHGYESLGLKEGFVRVGKALKKFDIQIEEHGKREGYKTFKLIDMKN